MKNIILIGASVLLLASCGAPTTETKVETVDTTATIEATVSADSIAKVDSVSVDTTSVK